MDDLISKTEATTLPVMPKEHREYQTQNLDDAYEQGWFDLQKCIENLPSAQPEWVSCSEKLPEDDVEVFVYLFDRPSPYIAWFREGCWFTEEFQVEKENYPKAWMPLPEPYREE